MKSKDGKFHIPPTFEETLDSAIEHAKLEPKKTKRIEVVITQSALTEKIEETTKVIKEVNKKKSTNHANQTK